MAFEITGHKAALEGAFVRTQAHTAADALRFAGSEMHARESGQRWVLGTFITRRSHVHFNDLVSGHSAAVADLHRSGGG